MLLRLTIIFFFFCDSRDNLRQRRLPSGMTISRYNMVLSNRLNGVLSGLNPDLHKRPGPPDDHGGRIDGSRMLLMFLATENFINPDTLARLLCSRRVDL